MYKQQLSTMRLLMSLDGKLTGLLLDERPRPLRRYLICKWPTLRYITFKRNTGPIHNRDNLSSSRRYMQARPKILSVFDFAVLSDSILLCDRLAFEFFFKQYLARKINSGHS